jgi:hypothetical protein
MPNPTNIFLISDRLADDRATDLAGTVVVPFVVSCW